MGLKFTQVVVTVAAGLCSVACSTTNVGTSVSGWMPVGASTLPPAGFTQFCDRRPGDCDAAPAMFVQAADAPTGAVVQDAWAVLPATAYRLPAFTYMAGGAEIAVEGGALPAPAPDSLIHEAAAPRAAPGFASALAQTLRTPEAPVRLSKKAVWNDVKRINAFVNRSIRQATDEQIYGVSERWVLPLLEGGIAIGDCEDFALEKRRLLLEAGVPESAMFFAVGVQPQLGRHLVLIVSTDAGDYVLDSVTPWILRWDQTAYQWSTRQVSARSRAWVEIRQPAPQMLASGGLVQPAS